MILQNKEITGFYYNGRLQSLDKGFHHNKKFVNDLAMLLCDFWWDIDYQNTQNEGGVSFFYFLLKCLLANEILS